MKKRYSAASFATLVLLGFAASAEHPGPVYEKVLPGDASLDVSRMAAHTVRYAKPGGTMRYDMQRVSWNGDDVYRLYVYFQDENAIPDTMYFDAGTLAYRGRKLVMPKYTIDVAVDAGHFTGALIPSEGSDYTHSAYDKKHAHDAFEPAVINYFIAALPLAEGYKASIPVFDLNKGSQLLWSNIEVLGRETVTLDGTEYDTWKVLSRGIREKTIWVSTSEPYAIKMKTGGSRGTWKLVR